MTTTHTGQQRFLPSTPAPGVEVWHFPIGPRSKEDLEAPVIWNQPALWRYESPEAMRERWREEERQAEARQRAAERAEQESLQRYRDDEAAKRAELERRQAEDARALADAPATAWRLVDHGTAEITRADAKAGFAGTVELAALFAVVDGKAGIHGPLHWVAGALLIAAVIVTVLAVWPSLPSRNTGHEEGGSIAGHWLHFGALRYLPADELAARIQTGHLEGICHQATALSRIAYSKHVRLRWSLLIALAGVVAAVLATI